MWLSHDLHTPFAGTRTISGTLEGDIAPGPASYHRVIVAKTECIAAVVDDVLTLAGLQSDTLELNPETVTVSDLASDFVGNPTPLTLRRDVRPMGSVEGDPNDVTGDAGSLSRALQNIIGNTIACTRPGIETTVVVSDDDGTMQVQVRDGCDGSSPEALRKSFAAGWCDDRAYTPGTGPENGLDPPVTRTIAATHRDTVDLQNQPPGCEVAIKLPGAAVGAKIHE